MVTVNKNRKKKTYAATKAMDGRRVTFGGSRDFFWAALNSSALSSLELLPKSFLKKHKN